MTSRYRLVALLTAALLSLNAAQQPPFRAGVETVRVDVLVTRGGRPVEGLTARDFQVRDNGVVQQVDHAAFENIPLNIVLVLDGSSSVTGERAEHLLAASRGVLSRLEPDDQAALVSFGDAVVVRSGLTKDLGLVRKALDEPAPLGGTSLVDAAYAAILLGESQPGRALVIVFTDGVEVSSYLNTDAAIETVKRSACVVYGVEQSGGPRRSFLRDLTDASGGDLFQIGSTSDLEGTFLEVLDQFRHRYLVSYTPRGVEAAGWHRLQVQVQQRGVTVKARPGYNRD